MKKRAWIVLFLIFLIIASIAVAQDEETTDAAETTLEATSQEQLAYNWLVDAAANGNYGNDVATTALAGLALSSVGYEGSASLSAEWILTQKDAKNCFPKGECKVKDTALALMLFDSLAMPEKAAVQEWLEKAQSASATQGKWLIEISTQATGKCTISYGIRNKTLTEEVQVNQGKFPSCSDSNFLDINSCFKSGLLNEPGRAFTVDCSALEGETPIITLLYNKDSTFYVINTVFGSVAELTTSNGCYGRTEKGACNKEASLYAAWALSKVKSSANINLYLIDNYDATSIENNAIIYLTFLTKDEKYLDAIKTRQSTDGSFNKDFYQTALATLALQDSPLYTERVDKAKSWLEEKQSDDGSWRQNARDTAMVLYAAYGDAVLQPEAVKEATTEESGPCNYDWVCDTDETAESCTDCQAQEEEDVCNSDGTCDSLDGETTDNCADCSCGDGICDSSEDFEYCPDDCEEEEPAPGVEPEEPTIPSGGIGFGTIMIIVLIVLLVIVGGYLALKKFRNKPGAKAKPSPFGPRPGATPLSRITQTTARAPPKTPSRGESQLQKSLEEARKLLRK